MTCQFPICLQHTSPDLVACNIVPPPYTHLSYSLVDYYDSSTKTKATKNDYEKQAPTKATKNDYEKQAPTKATKNDYESIHQVPMVGLVETQNISMWHLFNG
jgi:hypothetical protein